ncbi:ribonuclease H-like domain-containing protein, partial [Mycena olivaceomarginata]
STRLPPCPNLTSAPGPSSIPSAPAPSTPLRESYTYHSPTPTADGPYILGVYGVAYCPVAYKEKLEDLGFADSKTLTAEIRSGLLDTLSSDPANLGWSVRVISPQAISSGMLRRPPANLNVQSQDATILLIQEVLKKGIELTEVYVDALGTTSTYQAYLSSCFPGINFTVESKADDKYKIVGAASVAAKVTRDACIEDWVFEENIHTDGVKGNWATEELGSGYPGDPKTKEWLRNSIEPVFGLPKLVRFSWSTVKVLLEKEGKAVQWSVARRMHRSMKAKHLSSKPLKARKDGRKTEAQSQRTWA